MVCANGKQNSHIGNFRLGWRIPFEQQTQLTERAQGDFDIFKMAAEIVVFNHRQTTLCVRGLRESITCVASVSVQFGSKELLGDEWSE